ncbi:ROK family transcriptional regulator [Promicromonospora sukumoe]|uniref:ROK family transcriptional regulator n=1 Tax=Promicromonospora sukumoe TaxID=88382 RepID=UPI0003A0557B|nr:ROK family protein [Promicromonospora sukumoe]
MSRAPQSGSSSGLLRRINTVGVLEFAWDHDVFTATEAMEATGLTRSTVISRCAELIELGWMREVERVPEALGKGRPARLYRLRADAGYVVGVDAGQHRVLATVCDLRGAEVGRQEHPIDPEHDNAADRLALTDTTIEEALASGGVDPARVLAIAVGVPAQTDVDGASPPGQNEFWARMNPGFAAHFRERGWHTTVENDANLAAHAERALGAGHDARSFAALLSGERFGAGIVVDGALVRGSYGGAGEMRLLDYVVGVGSPHGIGYLARTWGREARESGDLPADSTLGALAVDAIDAPAVFAAAADGDVGAVAVVDRLADRLARVCAVIDGMLDVDRIIVAGGVAPVVGDLLRRTAVVLEGMVHPPAPELVASSFGADAVIVGASTLALDRVRTGALDFVPGSVEGE